MRETPGFGKTNCLAFGSIGNLKFMLMRSQIQEPVLLSVAADCRGDSNKSSILCEEGVSAVSLCVRCRLREIAARLG